MLQKSLISDIHLFKGLDLFYGPNTPFNSTEDLLPLMTEIK
jgi:hypothetical protein